MPEPWRTGKFIRIEKITELQHGDFGLKYRNWKDLILSPGNL